MSDLATATTAHGGLVKASTADHPLLRMALTSHVNKRGKPMAFRDRPYMIEWLVELPRTERTVIRSCTQNGKTEVLFMLALHDAGHEGRTVAYVLPTWNVHQRVVQDRFDPLLARVPAYRALLPGGLPPSGYDLHGSRSANTPAAKGGDNLRIKHLGAGTILFLAATVQDNFVEFSADTAIVDEYDRCAEDNEANLAMLPDRLQASASPRTVLIANPQFPTRGITGEYQKSDQRRWHGRCEHCRAWQPFDWFRSVVDRDDAGRWVLRDRERSAPDCGLDPRPVCLRCGRPFERGAVPGAWIPARPGDLTRGYWANRLDVLSQAIRPLYLEWLEAQTRRSLLERFYASILGIAYDGGGTQITATLIQTAATGPALADPFSEWPDGPVRTMGVDVGSVFHVVISTLGKTDDGSRVRTLSWAGTLGTVAEVAALARRAGVRVLVIDIGPERRLAAALRDDLNDDPDCLAEGWMCEFYQGDRTGTEDYALQARDQEHVVKADRTQLLDATLDDFTSGRRVLPVDIAQVPDFAAQLIAPIRKLDERGTRYRWDEGSAPDHYRLADAYDRVAADLYSRGGTYSVVDLATERTRRRPAPAPEDAPTPDPWANWDDGVGPDIDPATTE